MMAHQASLVAHHTRTPEAAPCGGRNRCVLSLQLFEHGPGLLEIGGVKAPGKPAVDWREKLVDLSALALLLPQATEAQGGAQLQRLRLLAAGDVQGSLQPGFRLR